MPLSDTERRELLRLAREAVDSAVLGRPAPTPTPDELTGVLAEQRGCFVTLTNRGRLRGCIGTFAPRSPLGEMIVEMGRAAARQDPRFLNDPITEGELNDITVQVSVLSPLARTAEPEKLEVGTHGIYVVSPQGSGCFLPEVATDQGWDAVEFLDACCTHKAGVPAGSWRYADTKVYLFSSEKFSE